MNPLKTTGWNTNSTIWYPKLYPLQTQKKKKDFNRSRVIVTCDDSSEDWI